MRRAVMVLPLAVLLTASGCWAAPAQESAVCASVPSFALRGHVTDRANILDRQQEVALVERLRRYEAKTKHQMVIVTVAHLGGRDIAEFSQCYANRWGVGRKEQNDGIVILVAPNERRARVATGTGMEKLLSDTQAQNAVDLMTTRFGAGDFAGGLKAGVDRIAAQTGDAE